jgi:hypothetical protein
VSVGHDRPARKVGGIFGRGNPHSILKIFKIKSTRIAGYNVVPLIVFLNLEGCEHRGTHINSNLFQVLCQSLRNPKYSFQNMANSQQTETNRFRGEVQHLSDHPQRRDRVLSGDILDLTVGFVSRRSAKEFLELKTSVSAVNPVYRLEDWSA